MREVITPFSALSFEEKLFCLKAGYLGSLSLHASRLPLLPFIPNPSRDDDEPAPWDTVGIIIRNITRRR